MTHVSDHPPAVRRDLFAVAVLLSVASLTYYLGHIPGVVNSATLIAAGLILWAGFKLISLLRRAHRHAVARVVAVAAPHRGRQAPTHPRAAVHHH
ncbi:MULTISPECIES: hypothetical protein [Gordonia]|uniref:hypothetical protein n=1 Tax=Gordonia TaxID=2053 RepID=UPI0002DD3F9F|nr:MULTISPECIES: hypothetical protein [Gordonia]MCZ4581557.1 hypothetical protein [Gordonia amicalis]